MSAKMPYQGENVQARRIRMLAFAMGATLLLLVIRLAYWQLPAHPELDWWRPSGEPDYMTPVRGGILDANGYYLTRSTFASRVMVVPGLLEGVDREALTVDLAEATGMRPSQVAPVLASDAMEAVMLAVGAPIQVADRVDELLERKEYAALGQKRAVSVVRDYQRVYPDHALAAHLLGFVSLDGKGNYGLESAYETLLTGTRGRSFGVRGPWGDAYKIGEAGYESALDGADLILTVDRNVQYAAEDLLTRAMMELGAESGSLLVMDPRTGAIIAMAKRPTFSPGRYWSFASMSWFNNDMVSVAYEPGSTIKAMTVAIALEEGAVHTNSYYVDEGSIEIGGRAIYNADGEAYGRATMTEMLAYSLNVGAATVAQSVGPTAFYQHMRDFGFGEPTGIGLSEEVSGTMRVPTQAEWSMADFGRNAFGQGFSATPLQVACAFATLANGGLRIKPYLVSEISSETGSQFIYPQRVKQVLSPLVAEQVTELLADAVELGMAEALVPGYRIAGKSGTSSIAMGDAGYDNDEVITSFVGYGPLPDPRWVILVKFDKPQIKKWGTESAAPVFRDMFEYLVSYYGVEPTAGGEAD